MPTLAEVSVPRVDIIDHDTEIEVQAALPGVKKEDLDVSIHNQTIYLAAPVRSLHFTTLRICMQHLGIFLFCCVPVRLAWIFRAPSLVSMASMIVG